MTHHHISDDTRLLTKKEITFIQRATGKLLYCARAAGSAMLRALKAFAIGGMPLALAAACAGALREKLEALLCFSSRCCSLIFSSLGRRAAPVALHVEGSVEASVLISQALAC